MPDKYQKIGEILAAARLEQNKTIKEASEVTKIRESYLEAVETGQPDKLPSAAYFGLFARSYAQFLALDPAILDEIAAAEPVPVPTGPDATPPAVSEDDSRRQARVFGRNLVLVILAAIVLFVVFIVLYYWLSNSRSRPTGSGDHEAAADPVVSSHQDTMVNPPDVPYEPYVPPPNLTLSVLAKQDVWVMVVRDGDTVLNRSLATGDVRKWEAKYRFVISLGISNAVELTLNDVKLPPLADQSRTITNLEINQVNCAEFLARAKTVTTEDADSVRRTASGGFYEDSGEEGRHGN